MRRVDNHHFLCTGFVREHRTCIPKGIRLTSLIRMRESVLQLSTPVRDRSPIHRRYGNESGEVNDYHFLFTGFDCDPQSGNT